MAKPLTAGAPLETLLTIVNVALLFGLFAIFFQQWRRTKSTFSLGLVAFAAIFLLKEFLSVLQTLDRAAGLPVIGPRVQVLLALGETAALGVLLYIVAR
jgi:hypothetical protein